MIRHDILRATAGEDRMPDSGQTELAVFRLKARQAAQHCLHYLYFLESRRRPRPDHENGAHEVRHRSGVAIADRVLEKLGWALDGRMIDRYRGFAHGNMRALVDVVRAPATAAGDPVVVAWDGLRARLTADRFGREDVLPAIEAAQRLLDVSHPHGPIEGFNHTVRKVLIA